MDVRRMADDTWRHHEGDRVIASSPLVMSRVIETASGPLGAEWAAMTFPSFRPLLEAIGSVNPSTGGTPVAVVSVDGGQPVGLALAEIAPETGSAELLSLYVAQSARGRGVATTLVERLEQELRGRGVTRLEAVYMTGKPSIPVIEHIFEKRGFDAPILRKVVVRFTAEEAATTEWYQRARLPADSEIFAWKDVRPEEIEELKRTHAENPWIDVNLEPWRCSDRFDPVSSVGMRKQGKVVGWVINHPIGPNLLCFTTSFVRRDLARRGAIFPLYVASLERLKGTGTICTFVTSAEYESMVRFVLRRCAPYISFCGETRGVSKTLVS
jgi:GNAT superfamily N-acetyltransferase